MTVLRIHTCVIVLRSNSPKNMSQGQSPNSTYEWLAKSIQEGFIKHYSEDDIVDRTLLGHGGYGVVYKAQIKHSGILVAMKTLFLNRYGCEDELYKQFVKEVVIYHRYLISCSITFKG